ncbi:MAG: hypothetical protein Q9219_001551 [cf. Caloplaca sp. 3 TL-2023]
MEARKGIRRGFKELKAQFWSAQSGSDRFPKPDGSTVRTAPPAAIWRNNLAALSQYYNLFFVASLSTVLVYEPANQEQYLPAATSKIHVARSGSGLGGYIDAAHPHTINHLVVDDLGFEELLIAVCDDGDVVAYTTRSIRKEIDGHALDAPDDRGFKSELLPFFIRTVRKSAWGIAVCKEARMIAVSSNSQMINVFAFALGGPSSSTSDADVGDDDQMDFASSLPKNAWVQPELSGYLDPQDRSRNLEIILSAHDTNIPSIAFYNPFITCVDKVYLVSTDINGTTYIWDVWQRTVIKEITIPIVNTRGWGVVCLDPYYCQKAKTCDELFGGPYREVGEYCVDTTMSTWTVPRSDWDMVRNPISELPSPNLEYDEDDEGFDLEAIPPTESSQMEQLVGEEGNVEHGSPMVTDDSSENDTLVSQAALDTMDDVTHSSQTASNSSESTSHDSGIQENEPRATTTRIRKALGHSPETTTGSPGSTASDVSSLEGCVEEMATLFSGTSEPVGNALRSRFRVDAYCPRSLVQLPFCPFHILQTTQTDIRLWYDIELVDDGSTSHEPGQEILCEDPIIQSVHDSTWRSGAERLNLVLSVPELGLVIIGNQAGRVALLTITHRRAVPGKDWLIDGEEKTGFRIEKFLPYLDDEDGAAQPKTELLGAAVGPTAAHLRRREDGLDDGGDDWARKRRKWRVPEGRTPYRLMLYYRDHTVLSYEIARPD